MAAAVIAVRNARARREKEKGLFGGSQKTKRPGSARPSSARTPRGENEEAGASLWESIFGKKPDPTRRTNQYSVDGIKRAEISSIAKVVGVIGCTEEEARAQLVAKGWSVHDTVASMINQCRPQSAAASLGASSPSAAAAGGQVLGRGREGWAEEPSEDDKNVAVALFLSVVSNSDKEEAEQYLRKNRWNVQEALRFALDSNPGLPLFDGQGCHVPVGVPISMVEAGHNVVPQGGDVWETQSNMTELPESDGNIPIGIAIER